MDLIRHSTQKPLNVLHVIASMASLEGGPPIFCTGLTAALAARGHTITVATVDEEGQPVVPLDPRVTRKGFARTGWKQYVVSEPLDRWLRENVANYDLVHLHSLWQFPTFAAARACWGVGKPYIVILNGMLDRYSVFHRSAFKKRLYWMLREGRIHRRAAAIHCLNHAEIRSAVPWIKDLPKFIGPIGIDEAVLAGMPTRGAFRAARGFTPAQPLVLFLSRVHPKKGLDRLLPAWKALADRMPEVRLLIAGSGDPAYVASLNKMVDDLGLKEKVLFLGHVAGRDKWQILADCDVFVLPSHQEGFSMAILEALAAGCTPVVTQECNFDELEPAPPEKPLGVIIRGGDMGVFVSAVEDLLRNPARRQALAEAGRHFVTSRFTWQKVTADLETTYRRILAGEKLPANP